ncbi:hypothetical protein EYF80_045879 [Liparis tanakae]|uniref:Uncharacterized protein n=1 Tax=Liparis tanakae TaxID=230148 RepID=A0A4Z2FRQ1_9TELE|nr:hypothetical protein EYF80_045879 [Liparis tanakae]
MQPPPRKGTASFPRRREPVLRFNRLPPTGRARRYSRRGGGDAFRGASLKFRSERLQTAPSRSLRRLPESRATLRSLRRVDPPLVKEKVIASFQLRDFQLTHFCS